MSSLSVCVIAKNEERFLHKSLSSIKGAADEIIFVDTGSSDNTVKIAKQFTNKIYHFKWCDDFSAAYNFCTDLATKEYIFRWDADFYLPKKYQESLLAAKEKDFFGANLLNFLWSDIDTATYRPVGVASRDFIYKTKEFYSYLPVHSYIKPIEGVQIKRAFIDNLILEHYKHHQQKALRYDQSFKMLERALKNGFDIPYLNFHYILALVYSEKYAKAANLIDRFLNKWLDYTPNKVITLLEKKLACFIALDRTAEIDPRSFIEKYQSRFENNKQFLLFSADVWALSEPIKALELYRQYLADPPDYGDIGGPYIYARYQEHPNKILKDLSKRLADVVA